MPDPEPVTQRRVPFRAILDIVASIVMIGAAGLLAWSALAGRGTASTGNNTPAVAIPDEPLSLQGAPILGSAQAPVALVMFSDFECPFCGRFAADILPGLKKQFIEAGHVQLAFRHLALPNHTRAVPAAIASECAARQGAFWPFHDRAFTPPMRLAYDDLRTHAGEIGLNLETFEACWSDDTARARVTADGELAQRLGVRGTPTFFAGRLVAGNQVEVGETVAGARPLEEFERVIRALLSGS
jgi:protein-disulfide isomerase